MLEIDGSYGEGGGSIVRLSAAFSAVTGKAVRIYNIRSKRDTPGLMAQHLTAINAAAQLCNTQARNAFIGSREIWFHPGKITGGNYVFDVKTAGSISLVLQALMIPAFHAEHPSKIIIKGGTHVPKAPSVNYLRNVTLPLLRKMEYCAEIVAVSHGFFPRGRGIVETIIQPSKLNSMNLTERGDLKSVKGTIVCSDVLMERNVGERMRDAAIHTLEKGMDVKARIAIEYVPVLSAGCGMDIIAEYEHSVLGGSAVGELKKSAEAVGKEAAEMLLFQHKSKAAIDEHAADQIIPYLALAEGKSRISVSRITEHTKTNIWLLEQFLERKFRIKGTIIEIA